MSRRYFTSDVLKEWISQGYKYVLFTDNPYNHNILVKPLKELDEVKDIILYESHLLAVDECDSKSINAIHFIDGSLKLVCED